MQYRDLMVAWGKYPGQQTGGVVPVSDMAGEVLEIGDRVTNWKKGDRVCANFNPEHIYGDITGQISPAAFGAAVDGVLTQYKVFSAQVRYLFFVRLGMNVRLC